MRKTFLAVAMTAAMALSAAPARAAAIVGELDLAGALRLDTAGLLDWLPQGGGTGIASISMTTNTGYFSVFNGGVNNAGQVGWNIQEVDLLATTYTASGCSSAQQAAFPQFCGSFTELQNFETTPSSIQTFLGQNFTSPLPNLTFSLTSIAACTEGCNFGFAPQFNVTYTDGNTAVIMNVKGIVCDPGSGVDCSNYVGIFTAQFPGIDPGTLLARLDTYGYIQTSFSASKITASPIPEPTTLLLFGTGSVAMSLIARRRQKKQARKDNPPTA